MRAFTLTASAIAALLLGCGSASAAPDCAPRAPTATTAKEVGEQGLVAQFLQPTTPGKHPALLILGGSEGGSAGVRQLAKPFAEQGYAVLALSYFAAPGLPATAEELPLEYFDRAVAWLAAQPSVDPKAIGVYGVSKGAEASLLVASRNPALKAAGAGVGTSFVWQGISTTGGAAKSSWTLAGKPVDYLPYGPGVRFDPSNYMAFIYGLYDTGLKAADAHPQAAIPVEKIHGPVMLISGRADAMWSSSAMSDAVVARLKAKGFAHKVSHLAYPDAGHTAGMPALMGGSDKGADEAVGGTVEGNRFARTDMWPKLVCFFDGALKR
ncbi:acyl-CoA thioester hydrolase/BAAT C-terminal domain-containing protein [Caulobacter vibrioides]|uniref:Dienelactone hydrolase family protein n=2 Tax=Caulobacter vibrioides TaxID=155892 RepID=Q9A9T0_CAUVC|nr:acyl-CoA thioester hydrolase/BAAT C-terminal domain-containing protein [Caulobacter vibrioides]YP_002516299.1 acyl CoA thioesterase [Caulobacter vibrioides NA1000]AAK22867.1 dienelactone hydrolase family protein [Caulobacter vibrioides CB15]ACL94391.1 acyl CoA thioesterase [Caulobacter vibrioides NA1000]ATC27721.1 dienelactone hydrolase [Caulobacter vibrioides]QXZ52962.1 dienelactone hydrolase [Caulobacter vibrioides]